MGGTMMGLLLILGLVVAVLWILMPFAVFGLKDLTKQLLQQQRETNQLLQKIVDHNNKQS